MENVKKKSFKISILTILIILFIGGCKINDDANLTDEEESYIYTKEEVTLPEKQTIILDLCYIKDNKLRIITNSESGNNKIVWDSEDNGETWVQVLELKTVLNLTDASYCNAFISDTGDIFCEIAENIIDTTDIFFADKKYCTIKEDGTIMDIPIELDQLETEEWVERWSDIYEIKGGTIVNGINTCDFTGDGQLLVTDYMGVGYRINQNNGEILTKYIIGDEIEWVEGLGSFENTLVAVSQMGTLFYNLETGEAIAESDIEKEIMKAIEEAVTMGVTASSRLQESENGSILYVYTDIGLYEYTEGGSIRQLAENSKSVNANSSTLYTKTIAVVDEELYFSAVLDIETNTERLYRFTRTSSNEIFDTEITVWSLEENGNIRQAVSLYEEQHNNVKVNVEIGMTGEDGMTVSDAIKQLNTEIMAGGGPDVIFLDQLPIDAYLEKGVLVDLTDVLDSINQKEGIFENIANTYEENSELYAIPSRFTILSIEGKEEAIEATQNMETLVEYVDQLKLDNPEVNVFEKDEFNNVCMFFYYATSSTWLTENGVDKDALISYCQGIKQIFKLDYQSDNLDDNVDLYGMFVTVNYYDLATEELEIATDYIGAAGYQFAGIEAVKDKVYGMDSSLVNTDTGNLYIPTNIVGVSRNSKELDIAKEFVTCLLSKEIQSQETEGGMPINRQAFSDSLVLDEEYELPFENITLNLRFLSDEKKEEIIGIIESLDTSVNRDAVIMETVFENLKDYLNDSLSVEDAVNNMIKKIELYMEE